MELPNILDVPMQKNDADAATIREYLIRLLTIVWDQGSDFSSKRPFGYAGSWQFDVYEALVRTGYVSGEFDEDGHLEDIDNDNIHRADELILFAIRSLGGVD